MTQGTRRDVLVTLQTETAEFVMHTSESDVSVTNDNESSTRCYCVKGTMKQKRCVRDAGK